MLKFEFHKIPVNMLIGAKWNTFTDICKGKIISKTYRKKYYLTKFICRILSLFQSVEKKRLKKIVATYQYTEEPLFILGHWRSGTTFLHNILSCDKHFGYVTTYQTIFPNLMLTGQRFFKGILSKVMPSKRPTDNMDLNVDLPQEEEFAIMNMTPFNYYNFWTFPQSWINYANKYLTFHNSTQTEKQQFQDAFKQLVTVALHNTKGTQFLSKNPPHTARIKEILEIYPKAKFIYLIRNPYTVFESTRSFFTNTIQSIMLEDISKQEIEDNILEVYKIMHNKYERDKQLIPDGNLLEIKFEDLEHSPFEVIKNIYSTLSLSGLEASTESILTHLSKNKQHTKTQYQYTSRTIDLVNTHWGFVLTEWDYDRM